MRQRAKTDRNHQAIIDAMRAMGWYVKSLHQVGGGFPDLLAGKAGQTVLVEVKDGSRPPSERKLTRDQVDEHAEMARHGIRVVVVTCVEDLVQLDREARVKHETAYRVRDYYDVGAKDY